MDNRLTRPRKLHESYSFYGRRRSPTMAYNADLNTTVLIITLFCLVFYGRLSTILFTCAWMALQAKSKNQPVATVQVRVLPPQN